MKRSEVFEVREPPPHGWTRVKARLEGRRRRWPWVLALTLCAPVMAVWVRPLGPEVDPAMALLALEKLQGSVPTGEPVTALAVQRMAVLRVPTHDPQVVMYRVAMLAPDDPAPPE